MQTFRDFIAGKTIDLGLGLLSGQSRSSQALPAAIRNRAVGVAGQWRDLKLAQTGKLQDLVQTLGTVKPGDSAFAAIPAIERFLDRIHAASFLERSGERQMDAIHAFVDTVVLRTLNGGQPNEFFRFRPRPLPAAPEYPQNPAVLGWQILGVDHPNVVNSMIDVTNTFIAPSTPITPAKTRLFRFWDRNADVP